MQTLSLSYVKIHVFSQCKIVVLSKIIPCSPSNEMIPLSEHFVAAASSKAAAVSLATMPLGIRIQYAPYLGSLVR